MNSTVWPIFNESLVEKKDLWIPWTVHRTHCRQHPSASQKKKKKKKKKKENANIAPKTRIQIHTKKSVPACGLII